MDQAKHLEIPPSLLIYETLLSRKVLSPKEKQQYERIQKGFDGEWKLIHYLNKMKPDKMFPLFNCLFDVNGQEIQIDCLLLTNDTIFLLEVKNFTGDYYFENSKIYSLQTRNEIYNPMMQIERTEFLFKRLLRNMRVQMPVRSFILFVNHRFMLYCVNPQLPMIFPSQVERFLQKTGKNANPLTQRIRDFADHLMEQRKSHSRYEQLPEYHLSELKRGLFCWHCHKKLVRDGQLYFSCPDCRGSFHIDSVVMYAVAQFHLLFPVRKITPRYIVDWCDHIVSRVFISRLLSNELEKVAKGKYTYYKFRDKEHYLDLLMRSKFITELTNFQ